MKTPLVVVVLALAPLSACGGGPPKAGPDPRYPPQPEGCAVTIFHDSPTMSTDNIGPVWARCNEDVSDVDCLRTLQDQVCKLGGNVAWGVPMQPTRHNGKNEWSARAAHTRTLAPN